MNWTIIISYTGMDIYMNVEKCFSLSSTDSCGHPLQLAQPSMLEFQGHEFETKWLCVNLGRFNLLHSNFL